jgi:hypothetical protein
MEEILLTIRWYNVLGPERSQHYLPQYNVLRQLDRTLSVHGFFHWRSIYLQGYIIKGVTKNKILDQPENL